jgi:hypothetical protein
MRERRIKARTLLCSVILAFLAGSLILTPLMICNVQASWAESNFASFAAKSSQVDSASNAAANSPGYWMNLAANAWNFFKPGYGVDASTGLMFAAAYYPYFTDWETGAYIQALIDAEKLGLIEATGPWGANDRIEKVLAFLENRPLTAEGLPYICYSATTGKNQGDTPQVATDAAKLFVALKNLEDFKPALKTRIDFIVYNQTNYEPRKVLVDLLLEHTKIGRREPSIYDYYVALGFSCFWPGRFLPRANELLNYYCSQPYVNYQGIELPKVKIACDPLLYLAFDFKGMEPWVKHLLDQVYRAHEMRYNLTGDFVAFGEGNTGLENPSYVYEFVVLSDGRMWVVQTVDAYQVNVGDVAAMPPIVYLKASVAFQAMYNTPFTNNMLSYTLAKVPVPVTGYVDGMDESGRVSSCSMETTNSLILSAARYAIDKINTSATAQPTSPPSSTPTPSVVPPQPSSYAPQIVPPSYADTAPRITQTTPFPTLTPKASPSPIPTARITPHLPDSTSTATLPQSKTSPSNDASPISQPSSSPQCSDLAEASILQSPELTIPLLVAIGCATALLMVGAFIWKMKKDVSLRGYLGRASAASQNRDAKRKTRRPSN